MFRHCGATLHPVAAVDVTQPELVVHDRMMNVTADHAVDIVARGLRGERLLKSANVVDGVLDLQLRPLRQRPIWESQPAPYTVEDTVGGNGEVVGAVAKQREPARLRHNEVEDVAMDHEIAASVSPLMDRVLNDLDAAGMRAAVAAAQKLIVIAGDVDDACAFARLAQQFLHHVVVRLRPVPTRPQRPTVDDIAHEVDGVGFVPAEEIEQSLGLAAPHAEMHIGEKQRPEAARLDSYSHVRGDALTLIIGNDLCLSRMSVR